VAAKIRVLVIDDDPMVRRSCRRILEGHCDVQTADSGGKGLSMLASEHFDLALVDLKLPDTNGMEILRQAPDRFPDVPLIIITGYSTIQSAVEAIKMGAFDYVAKPFAPDELEAAVEKAVRQRRLLRDYRHLQDSLSDCYRFSRFIGDSPAMKRVFALIEQVAGTDTTVLVTGASGTGKELVARAIHFSGTRKDAPFVAVDCGAIAPNLIASELFGHVRGAFTGAVGKRTGLIRTADGGTLFLDEIGNLPLDLQTSLLRVIETGQVRAVGASDSVAVDVRYIAATNRDLRSLVDEEKFREDLFYRLNVFPIDLPPLSERREDIPALCEHFLAVFAGKMHKRIDGFTPEALDVLTRYEWPGNVRELSNIVERLVILCGEGTVGSAHVREFLAASVSPAPVPQTVQELNDQRKKLRDEAAAAVEKAFLMDALRRNDYNVTRAATQTGMQRSNFQALLRKHDLRIRDLIGRRGIEDTH